MKAIIIVFDQPQYLESKNDKIISIDDIKEVCDFDDRWETFEKYISENIKNEEYSFYIDNDGFVRTKYILQNYVFGIIRKI